MLNVVVLIGRLGNDPELRYTQTGNAVARLNLATHFRYIDKDGNLKEITDWHKVVAWDKQAETAAQYLSKGSLIAVVGRIYTRQWKDSQGETRYTTEIRANRIIFLNGKKTEGQTQNHQEPPAEDVNANDDVFANSEPAEAEELEDDVPF